MNEFCSRRLESLLYEETFEAKHSLLETALQPNQFISPAVQNESLLPHKNYLKLK